MKSEYISIKRSELEKVLRELAKLKKELKSTLGVSSSLD